MEQTTWEIPSDWNWLTIEEITGVKNNKDNLVMGHGLATEKGEKGIAIARSGRNIPFILSSDLANMKEIKVSRWTTEEALDDNKIPLRYRPTAGRLLMALSWKGTAGKVGTFKGEGIHSHSVMAIIPRPEKVYLDYLFYCFREKRINAYATDEVAGGIKKSSVTKEHLRQVKIPVPPDTSEQRRIVERIETLLRDVQTGRGHLTTMKKDADGILDKVLAEVFADERLKQWAAGSLQKYMRSAALEPKPSLQQYGSYGSIEFDSIRERTGQLAQIPSFRERARHDGMSKYILEEDQDYLLFVKPSPEKRRIAVLHRKKAVCNTSIQPLSIRTSYQSDILLDFLMWELLALSLGNPIKDPLTCEVFIPSSIDEQHHIITYLEDIHNQVLRIQDNLKKSEAQFDEIEQGILHDAISGKLFREKSSS